MEDLHLRTLEHEALTDAVAKVSRDLQEVPDNTHRLEQWHVNVSDIEKKLQSARSELETAKEIRKSCMDDVASRLTELDEECALHTWLPETETETEMETDCDSCASPMEECPFESLEALRVRYSIVQEESSALSERIQSRLQERQLVTTRIQAAEAELRQVRLAAMFSTPQNTWLDCASLCDAARGAVTGCSRLLCGFRLRASPPPESVSLVTITC
jgi:chromosome segregation ATPase